MTSNCSDLPVLLILFNRLDTTTKLIDALRAVKPGRIFVFADGPRKNQETDADKCTQVREYIKKIDWPCELNTNFQDDNLGCGAGPAKAITWFFEHVEYGVILEDDCIPCPDFFRYEKEVLELYRDDERIMQVSGFIHDAPPEVESDYYFSKYFTCWGWGTWKRAWKHFTFHLEGLSDNEVKDMIRNYYPAYRQYRSEYNKYKKLDSIKSHVWDYHWWFCCYAQNGLCVFPKKNLITNIGFGDGRTHELNVFESDLKSSGLNEILRSPKYMIPDSRTMQLVTKKQYRSLPLLKKIRWHIVQAYCIIVDYSTVRIFPR